MKILISYCLMQLIVNGVFAQMDSMDTQWVHRLLRNEPIGDTIVYTDKPGGRYDELIRKAIQKDTLRGWFRGAPTADYIILTKAEKQHLRQSVKQAKDLKWAPSLFAVSRILPKDSMWPFIMQRNREISQVIINRVRMGDSTVIKTKIGDRVSYCSVFEFTPPVYLRNRTLMLFYFQRMCGPECGVQNMTLYKLEEGDYKRWLFLDGGEF